jgi:hypothetical protein
MSQREIPFDEIKKKWFEENSNNSNNSNNITNAIIKSDDTFLGKTDKDFGLEELEMQL